MSQEELARLIREIDRQMKAAAQALEFEKAALLRDQIFDLRTILADKEADDVPAWERERRMARLGVSEY
jgi:excinuclease ABC subunit B